MSENQRISDVFRGYKNGPLGKNALISGIIFLIFIDVFRGYRNENGFESCTPPWVFFTFFKLYKWYQMAQSNSYRKSLCIIL